MTGQPTGSVRQDLRTLFISDLHLGARAARPRTVLDFLNQHRAETIYLVGDVLDLWHGGRVYWSDTHQAVVDELERRARDGVRVVYLAGNHDAVLRGDGARLPAAWELREALTHKAADGQRYLVLHGDQCDARILRFHIMTRIGSRADAVIRGVDDWVARRFGKRQDIGNRRLRRAIAKFNGMFVMGGRFEHRLVGLARAAGTAGVICGHSHKPMMREIDGTMYANCGDWVDSFTALTETHDGTLRLVEWAAAPQAAPRGAPADAVAQEA